MRHFEKYTQEANTFINNLSERLGHPEEQERTLIIVKSVLHTLRDRIAIEENLNALSQLPMFLKAIYVDQWKYSDSIDRFNTLEEFIGQVEKTQKGFGEQDFDWENSTKEIVQITLQELQQNYWTGGQWDHIAENMPKELQEFFKEEVAV